jgi:hypothetical protein
VVGEFTYHVLTPIFAYILVISLMAQKPRGYCVLRVFGGFRTRPPVTKPDFSGIVKPAFEAIKPG